MLDVFLRALCRSYAMASATQGRKGCWFSSIGEKHYTEFTDWRAPTSVTPAWAGRDKHPISNIQPISTN